MKAKNSNKLPELWLLVTTFICILIGYFIGSSVRGLYEMQRVTFYSAFGSSISSSSENFDSRNLSQVSRNNEVQHADIYSPKSMQSRTITTTTRYGSLGFFPSGNVQKTVVKSKYLLTIAVGIQQKDTVNKIVSKFSEEFAIMLFHYDGRTSEWDQLEWSQRAIYISAIKQAKWWYAKRFLHPDVVAQFDYIFMWDEDLGVEHFNGEEYIKLVKEYDLEISQPTVTSAKGMIWRMTRKRNNVEVHKLAGEKRQKCVDPLLPPCAGFVEVMAPVFSRKSWNCVWQMIQNDLVHGWGLDFAFWRCVEKPHEKIGVVDAQWIEHLVFPTLGDQHQGDQSRGKRNPRIRVPARSFAEWKEFERRMKVAESQ